MTLYEIGKDLQALSELLLNLDGEIPEGVAGEALERWFNEIGAARDEKVRRYCGLISQLEYSAEAATEEARRIRALATASKNVADRLKNRLKEFFEANRIEQLDLGAFRPRVQANGGALPLIVPEEWKANPANAPEQFHLVKIDLDMQAIREAIRNDEVPEGVHLGERGTHLRLR